MEYEIKMLTLASEKCPFEDWYRKLKDTTTRARIRARITRIQSGNLGDCKSVGAGVSELRLDFGPGYRVYFAQLEQTLVVLLIGGDKNTQERDIENAQRMWEANKDDVERFQRDFRG